MINNIDLDGKNLAIVVDILKNNLSTDIKIWVFGSRITLDTKKYSDLDLALEDPKGYKIADNILLNLELEFEESLLPWKVDILDINNINENLRKIIEAHRILLY